jgi:hypothetical protein
LHCRIVCWHLDSSDPTWHCVQTITNVYHSPAQSTLAICIQLIHHV